MISILGLNIPNYPKKITAKMQSGLNIGEDQPSFTPFHAFGPDNGTQTCPVCKYGRYHGIVYFVGNDPDWTAIKNWLQFLEQEGEKRRQYLKVYFVYGNDKNYTKSERQSELAKLGAVLHIKHTALTFVPSFCDKETEAHLNKINPETANTFIIYKHRSIVDKYIDLAPTRKTLKCFPIRWTKQRAIFLTWLNQCMIRKRPYAVTGCDQSTKASIADQLSREEARTLSGIDSANHAAKEASMQR